MISGTTNKKKGRVIDFAPFAKRYWHWAVLLIILAVAANLRFYHADYPVIGYHNWKEVHYLTEARNFAKEGFFANGFFVPAFDYPDLDKDLSGAHSDSFPTTSILLSILFKLFGESLFSARAMGTVFNLGTIFFLYLLIKKIYRREDLALTTAAVMALNPLLTFFSRNVQLESPALFFMIAAAYYGVRWHAHEGKKDMLFGAILLAAAVLTRYDYAIIVFPLLFIFPWQRAKQLIFHPDTRRWWAIGALVLCIIPLWFWYSNMHLPTVLAGEKGAVYGGILNFGKVFEGEFWSAQKPALADNFTFLGIGMMIFGLAAFLALYTKGKEENKFMLGYLLGSMVWLVILADKLSGHSYHWFPLAPLFAFFVAFGFTVLGSSVERMIPVKIKIIHVLIVLLLFAWLWGPSIDAKNRQFDTQFYGLDVAGEYVNAHSEEQERIFHSSHQNYGVLWHADRKGFKNPGTVEELNLGEQYNASWIFLYQWGFELMQKPVWADIVQRYRPVQFAFVQQQNGITPVYLLLKKGGQFDENELNQKLQASQIQERQYELTGSNKFTLRYVDLE